MIRFEHVRKEYENAIPHKDVNGVVNDGDVVTIIGPSGTGKSTLLRMINGLEKPTSGKIFYNDEEITSANYDLVKLRRKVGMIFQSFNLFNNLSVLDNLVLPQLDILKIDKEAARKKALSTLKKMGLDRHYQQMPYQLSGGQKQRVAIARALVMEPEVILFDEPTSALDPAMVMEVENTIKWLADGKRTMLIVTHDMNFAREISTKIFYMDEGEIYETGTPEEIFDQPKRSRTKAFVTNQRLLDISIDKNSDFNTINNQLQDYIKTQKIDSKLGYNIISVFEELVIQNIIPAIGDNVVLLSLFYDGKNIDYKVKYGGNQFDPLTQDDSLSLKIVKNIISNYSYQYHDNASKPNSLKFNNK